MKKTLKRNKNYPYTDIGNNPYNTYRNVFSCDLNASRDAQAQISLTILLYLFKLFNYVCTKALSSVWIWKMNWEEERGVKLKHRKFEFFTFFMNHPGT
jgi:hypothetical protein